MKAEKLIEVLRKLPKETEVMIADAKDHAVADFNFIGNTLNACQPGIVVLSPFPMKDIFAHEIKSCACECKEEVASEPVAPRE